MSLAYMIADDHSNANSFSVDGNSFFIFANEIPKVALKEGRNDEVPDFSSFYKEEEQEENKNEDLNDLGGGDDKKKEFEDELKYLPRLAEAKALKKIVNEDWI